MLINCVAYSRGQRLSDITVEEISDYLEQPDCFVWVALKDASSAELAKMQEEFGLHPLALEDAQRGNQRAKIEEYGDSLFAVVKTVEAEHSTVQGAGLRIGEVDVFVGPNYVLSVRNHSEVGFADVRARCEREPHLLAHGAAFVLYALLDAVVDRYFPLVNAFEAELETIEEAIFTPGGERVSIQRLYQLKRKVMQLRHAVLPLLEAVSRLYGGRVPAICASSQEYFRDVADHLQRISATLDTIRDTIVTAIQVNLSLVAIDEGEVNKRLAAWAAIFAVATAFAGIWGMNFKHMPELSWHFGYPLALTWMVTVCGYLYWRFKKVGWL
ncbi:magnesium and cobalt transport protein CorA [Massilia sp. W12]|uniref:magnesium and cobalt transport protein CorA n=1 Tax=Massilia sp. W12 TaxID=3126507 RepID=UPI0030CCEA72